MSKQSQPNFRIGTRITQIGRNPAEQKGFVNSPVYRGSTVIFPTVSDIENNRAEFNYGTMGTPTIANLENAWSERRARREPCCRLPVSALSPWRFSPP